MFEEDIVIDWFCQISLAVRFCHEKKILHRDIKVIITKTKTFLISFNEFLKIQEKFAL